MPIVPEFQGGTPNVGVSMNQMPAAQQIQVRTDYGRLMNEAMKDVNDAAKGISEVLRIQHARTVKAESDDAEQEAVNIINTYMNSENGFMTLEGKNAMDAYESTVQGMTKDINAVIGKLQPATRDAVSSRINDRLNSAVNQATKWNNNQTQRYHLTSSESRQKMLIDSAAQNYADQEYLNKTWQSIESEIAYQANLLGLPAEATILMIDQNRGLFQATRYQAWSEDNPVLALANFKMAGEDIPADIAQKIEKGLFASARDVMAINLSKSGGAWVDDPLAKTGFELIDSLSQKDRLSVVLKAQQLRARDQAETQSNFKTEIANSLAAASNGEVVTPLSQDQFVEIYGEKKGQKLYDDYNRDFTMNQAVSDYCYAGIDEIQKSLSAFKPHRESETYAEDLKDYQSLQKAAAKVVKDRADDPMGYAIGIGAFGAEPLNLSNLSTLGEQLTNRISVMDDMSESWKTPKTILSAAESSMILNSLQTADDDQQTVILRQIAQAGPEALRAITSQWKGGNEKFALAVSAMDTVDQSGVAVGEMFIHGLNAIDQKRVKMDTSPEYGDKAKIYSKLGDEGDVEGVFTNNQALEATGELVYGVAAYGRLNGRSSPVDGAIASAVGEIYEHNRKKIVLPSGMSQGLFSNDFDDAITNKASKIKSSKEKFYFHGERLSPDQFASLLPSAKLQTLNKELDGSVNYTVTVNGEPVLNSERTPFILNIRKEDAEQRKELKRNAVTTNSLSDY